MKARFLRIVFCLLCALVVTDRHAYAAFTATHPTIPQDAYADSHGQVAARLEGGGFADRVEALLGDAWEAPWTAADTAYALTHAGGGGRSIMRQVVAYLYATGEIGQAQPPADDSADYPGKPALVDLIGGGAKIGRLEEYGLTTNTSPYSEKIFYASKYYQNKLTLATDAAWMARERGLYVLPESWEANPAIRQAFAALEVEIAEYGLNGTEAERQDALRAYFLFETLGVPGPIDAPSAPTTGALIVNPRRVFYRGRKIENALQQGRASDAAKLCTGVDWLVGATSRYGGYALQTYPLSESDWRAALGLPGLAGGSGGVFINGR